MVSGAIAGQKFPKITTKEGMQRLIDAVPDVGFYRTLDEKLSFNPPEMNTIGLLADPNIGPQNIVAVPLGGVNTGNERTGLIGPTQQAETPAEQYMREMKTDAPIPTPSPDAALKLGLTAGEGVAQDRNQGNLLSGLLGDIDYRGILNQLVKTFQRPEMLTPGVNALTAFGMAGSGLNQAEIAGAAAEQERMDKFALEQVKNAPKPPKPSAEITNLYKEMGVYQSGLNTFDRIKGILSKGIATGGAGSVLAGLNNIAAAFNINLSPDAQTSVNKAVAEIRTQLIASRAYGREANKDEQKLIRALIPEAGTFETIKELEEAYNVAAASMKRKANETNAVMTRVYGLPSYGTAVPNSPLFTRPNQGKQ